MIHFTIEQQINALLKTAARNGDTIVSFEIKSGYKGEYISKEGDCVFANMPMTKEGNLPYMTMPSIIQYRNRSKH